MKSIYLCGTMSDIDDYGAGWRTGITKFFKKFKQTVYNPCIEEGGIPQWERMPQVEQERIVTKDLDQIYKKTKAILCYFTKYSTGTVSELTFAYWLGLPIYIISKKALKKWPGTVSRSSKARVFKSFKDFKAWYKSKKGSKNG